MPFRKGQPGGPGRPRLDQMTVFNAREAARRHCRKAIAVLARCLNSRDEKVRIIAATALLDRGYGRPEIVADVAVHKFAYAIVPETMPVDEWLARKGQPVKPLPMLTLGADKEEPPDEPA
jgi:hypothetical protein